MSEVTLFQEYDNGLLGMAAGVKMKKHVIKSQDKEDHTIEVEKVEEWPHKDGGTHEISSTYTLDESARDKLKDIQGEVVDETCSTE